MRFGRLISRYRILSLIIAVLCVALLGGGTFASLGTTTRVSVDSAGGQANAWSESPSISANGRFVAFGSGASNLVPGDTNYAFDVFVHDRLTGTTEPRAPRPA